jgi:glycolate oxidase
LNTAQWEAINVSAYSKVLQQDLDALSAIAGPANVFWDREKMLPYSHDEVPGETYRAYPEVVVKPESTDAVAAIMRYANERQLPVTPRGAGTGLVGGAVPLYGGIALSLERMTRIVDVDKQNLMITVEPGVLTNTINEILAPDGLFYPGYPMSKESCTVGGNVATNAGGGRAVKYGVTGRYVMGLEAVLPTGEIMQLGGKRVKDVTGYNLIPLLVGSEGTLVVVTRIILKIIPLPTAQTDLLFLFSDIDKATGFASAIMAKGRIIPAGIEFMDRFAVEISCRYIQETLPHQAGALLLVQLDGVSDEELFAACERLGDLATAYEVLEIYSAHDAATSKKLWRVREAVPEAVKALYSVQNGEDIVVPVAAVSCFVTFLHQLAQKYGCDVVSYGHAGDGNIHARFLKRQEMSLNQWTVNLPVMLHEAYREAAALGGTISGEHGIGVKRKDYLTDALGPVEIALMKKIKSVFDPKGILNPGKVFP